MHMRSRLLVLPPLLLAALALGIHPHSTFAAGPPVQLSFKLPSAGAGAPDYQVVSQQESCTDSSCTSGTYGLVEVVQYSTATFGVPDVVVGECESWSGSTYSYAMGAGVDSHYPYYSDYAGSSTAGVGGAIGSSTSTSASGYAFAAAGTPGTALSSYGYGHVSVTGVDTANNVTGKMTSGSLSISISNARVATNSGTYTGSMFCTVKPGNYINHAYNTAN